MEYGELTMYDEIQNIKSFLNIDMSPRVITLQSRIKIVLFLCMAMSMIPHCGIFVGHMSDVNSCKFHPNESYLVTGGEDCTARLGDLHLELLDKFVTMHLPVM